MKKKIFGSLAAAALSLALVMPVMANTYTQSQDWNVTFTTDKEMVSNFHTSDMDDIAYGLQPGDNSYYIINLSNEYPEATNWYMTNKVIESLEDNSYNNDTAGGAYTYRLVYHDAKGEEHVLFDSDQVGGEDVSIAGEGLNEATSALQEYFYLDTLNQGDAGWIRLDVALDGETQNNDYQDTLAELQMNFAVELVTTTDNDKPNQPTTPDTPTRNTPQTGDDFRPMLYMAALTLSGLVLMILAIMRVVKGRKKEEA